MVNDLGVEEEVASKVGWLARTRPLDVASMATDASNWIAGQTYPVNAGLALRGARLKGGLDSQ